MYTNHPFNLERVGQLTAVLQMGDLMIDPQGHSPSLKVFPLGLYFETFSCYSSQLRDHVKMLAEVTELLHHTCDAVRTLSYTYSNKIAPEDIGVSRESHRSFIANTLCTKYLLNE